MKEIIWKFSNLEINVFKVSVKFFSENIAFGVISVKLTIKGMAA